MSYPFSHHLALNYGHKTESTLLGIYWLYTYDEMGQLTSGQKYLVDGTAIQGLSFGYEFDSIGSRKSTTINGETASYTSNSLNQYEQRDIPGVVNTTGKSDSSNITVDDLVTVRTEDYYLAQVALDNSVTIPYALEIKKDGVLTETQEGYLRSNPEFMSYDDDGNMVEDGLWNYFWNGENRLIQMTHKFENLELQFSYDSQGRRFRKRVLRDGILALERRFLYDGFNCIAELDENNALVKTMLWGLDLSGSQQGAGGVGGLLAVTNHVSDSTSYALSDGNGNVTGYVDSISGSLVYSCEYSPFGKVLVESGETLSDYGFSSKPRDKQTELVYFNYRYLNTDQGRWLRRDPIEEFGGLGLYLYCANDPVNKWDFLGMVWWDPFGWFQKPCCDDLVDEVKRLRIEYEKAFNEMLVLGMFPEAGLYGAMERAFAGQDWHDTGIDLMYAERELAECQGTESYYCKRGSAVIGSVLDTTGLTFAASGVGGVPAGVTYALSVVNGLVTISLCGDNVDNLTSLSLSVVGYDRLGNLTTPVSLFVNLSNIE